LLDFANVWKSQAFFAKHWQNGRRARRVPETESSCRGSGTREAKRGAERQRTEPEPFANVRQKQWEIAKHWQNPLTLRPSSWA
jgi:hypothetical protein